ncbi:hypothetical protein [Pontibacter brevis]
MARFRTISPLLLVGTTILLLGTAACVLLTKSFQDMPYEIDMSDEDENEYS